MIALTGLLAFAGTTAAHAEDSGKEKPAAPATLVGEVREALELGRKILAVRQAIANPQAPGAMEAVTALDFCTLNGQIDERNYNSRLRRF